MDDTNRAQTKETLKTSSDTNTVTAAAIEDVQSRILHGKELALVIAYARFSSLLVVRLMFLSPMMLSLFLVALDVMIVAPAAPVISSELKSLDELTWILTAFLRMYCTDRLSDDGIYLLPSSHSHSSRSRNARRSDSYHMSVKIRRHNRCRPL